MAVKVVDYTVVGMFVCCKFITILQITVREAKVKLFFGLGLSCHYTNKERFYL